MTRQTAPHTWLDPERRIIFQRMPVVLTAETARDMAAAAVDLAARLDDPARVRVCVDSKGHKRSDHRSRRILSALLDRPGLHRIAIHGGNVLERTMIKFIRLTTGNTRIQAF